MYGDTRVASHNWNNNFGGLGKIAVNLSDEGRRAHDVQSRYTEQPIRRSAPTLPVHISRGDTAWG